MKKRFGLIGLLFVLTLKHSIAQSEVFNENASDLMLKPEAKVTLSMPVASTNVKPEKKIETLNSSKAPDNSFLKTKKKNKRKRKSIRRLNK